MTRTKQALRAIIIGLFLLITSSGCQLLEPYTEGAAEKVAKGVNEYCANTDQDYRFKFRTLVNAQAAPNQIAVSCAGDK